MDNLVKKIVKLVKDYSKLSNVSKYVVEIVELYNFNIKNNKKYGLIMNL